MLEHLGKPELHKSSIADEKSYDLSALGGNAHLHTVLANLPERSQ